MTLKKSQLSSESNVALAVPVARAVDLLPLNKALG